MHPNIGDALSGSFFSIPHTLKALEEGETTKTPDIHIPSRSVGISIYTLIIQVPQQKVKEPFNFFLEGISCFFCQSIFASTKTIFFTSDNTGINFGVEVKE